MNSTQPMTAAMQAFEDWAKLHFPNWTYQTELTVNVGWIYGIWLAAYAKGQEERQW